MQESLHFTKMHSMGNDFVILDRIRQYFKISPEFICYIANRNEGIGCDQVLILDPPTQPDCDFEYRIFNHDGTEVEQCGNGARCIGRYAYQGGFTSKKHITLHALSGKILVDVSNIRHIRAKLGIPKFISPQLLTSHPDLSLLQDNRYKINIGGQPREFSFVSLGNPHCVIFLPSLQNKDIEEIADFLQSHEMFPQGVNVLFAQVFARNHMKCRVFERNTGETRACGSGACAAAIAGIQRQEVNPKVQVDMPGGSLEVEWPDQGWVILGGATNATFAGEFLVTEAWLAQS